MSTMPTQLKICRLIFLGVDELQCSRLRKLSKNLYPTFAKELFKILKQTKKEGINPLGLAAVTLILGCILGCPYRALDWSHLNYFDLAMLGKFKNSKNTQF